MASPIKFFMKHHQHKGKPFSRAMRANGWLHVREKADVVFIDYTTNREAWTKMFDKMSEEGSTIFIYPHCPTVPWWYDGIYTIDPRVNTIFVIGEEQKEAAQIFIPETTHIEVTGFPYCEQLRFKPCQSPKNVLFAPIHSSNENLPFRPEAIESNTKAFESLLKIPDIKLTVRYLGTNLERLGLWVEKNVKYIHGNPDGSYQDIDNADLVIAEGTYMFLAVARGKPTVGLNQHNPIRMNNDGRTPKRWDEYGHKVSYPIDASDGNLADIIKFAGRNEASLWRERSIGSQFNSRKFCQIVYKARKEDVTNALLHQSTST